MYVLPAARLATEIIEGVMCSRINHVFDVEGVSCGTAIALFMGHNNYYCHNQ